MCRRAARDLCGSHSVAGRAAVSLLQAVGLTELATRSLADYEELATSSRQTPITLPAYAPGSPPTSARTLCLTPIAFAATSRRPTERCPAASWPESHLLISRWV